MTRPTTSEPLKTMNKEVKFVGHDLMLVPMRMGKHWRLQVDIPQTEFVNIKDLPTEMFQEKNYEVVIRELPNE